MTLVDYSNIASAFFGFFSLIVALVGFYKVNSNIKNININHIEDKSINFDNLEIQKNGDGNNNTLNNSLVGRDFIGGSKK